MEENFICTTSVQHLHLDQPQQSGESFNFNIEGKQTYPEYFTVLLIAVLSGVVLPRDSEPGLAHIVQTGVLARLHLLYEPAGKLRLRRAERKHNR